MALKNKEKFYKNNLYHFSQGLSSLTEFIHHEMPIFHVGSTSIPTFQTITIITLFIYCTASLAVLVSGGREK